MISQTNASGDSYSILTDYQGSVSASASVSASGGALTLFAYSPFGKVRYQSNPDTQQGLGWLSRQFDSETGNNYLINRYYSSDRGSFLSPDQYQYVNNAIPFTSNLYQYGYANPLVNVDPEGLQTFSENEKGFANHSNALRIWKRIHDNDPHVSLQDVQNAMDKYRYTKTGSFERYIYTQQLPEDFSGPTASLYRTDKGYLLKEQAIFKEGQLTSTLTPVEFTMKDVNEFRRVPGLGEFWEGLTFNSMSGDATRLYRNQDGSFNIGFILGHSTQVVLDVLTAGEFKTKTPAVEVEKLSDLSLHMSSYVNTDVPVVNKLLTNEGGFVRMGRSIPTLLSREEIGPGVLIGEYMPRVRAAGEVTGLRTWPARNWEEWKALGVEKAKNRRWLLDQLRAEVPVYSLGKTPGFGRGEYFKGEVSLLLDKRFRRRFLGHIEIPGYGYVPLYKWIKR